MRSWSGCHSDAVRRTRSAFPSPWGSGEGGGCCECASWCWRAASVLHDLGSTSLDVAAASGRIVAAYGGSHCARGLNRRETSEAILRWRYGRSALRRSGARVPREAGDAAPVSECRRLPRLCAERRRRDEKFAVRGMRRLQAPEPGRHASDTRSCVREPRSRASVEMTEPRSDAPERAGAEATLAATATPPAPISVIACRPASDRRHADLAMSLSALEVFSRARRSHDGRSIRGTSGHAKRHAEQRQCRGICESKAIIESSMRTRWSLRMTPTDDDAEIGSADGFLIATVSAIA